MGVLAYNPEALDWRERKEGGQAGMSQAWQRTRLYTDNAEDSAGKPTG